MREFLYEYSMSRNDERINHDLFNRTFDKPLHEYIVNSCKNLEVIPNLELHSWECISDQSKINIAVNKSLNKDKKIKNNKQIDKLIPLSDTLTDLLRLTFKKTINGKEEYVTREVLVFKTMANGEYYIKGKKTLPLHQITENSTFVKDNKVNYKATLFGIALYKEDIDLKLNNGRIIKAQTFKIQLFENKINPLVYFLANFGLVETINRFDMGGIMSVVPCHVDLDMYYYLNVSKGVFLEVHKDAMDAHPFVSTFLATLYDALTIERGLKFDEIYNIDYWLELLSSQFSKKSVQKGRRVLISFSKIMDPTSRDRLFLPKWHRKDTFALMRWMMVNHSHILTKDNHDLANKRIRTHETLAYYFDAYITRNINSVLNATTITSESIDRLLNSISLYTMMNALYANKNNPYSLFRYERYNDFDAINLSRYTFKGPGGLNGGKYATSYKYRDIYPSHIDRFDLNVCSSSEPGLTGYLTANVDIKPGGYFELIPEPDIYDKEISDALDGLYINGYGSIRKELISRELMKNVDGLIQLSKKKTIEEMGRLIKDDPYKYGLYETSKGTFRLIPKYNLNKNGNIKLKSKRESKNGKKYVFNDKGQIKLTFRENVLKGKK